MSSVAAQSSLLHPALRRSTAATAVMLRGNYPVQPARRIGQIQAEPGINPAVPVPAATDPRWVLAVRAASQIQGGSAALLTPERRRGLLVLATQMGLRPFDASLVIAIVQDSARAGHDPLGITTESRLALVPAPPVRQARHASVASLLAASIGLAAAMFLALVFWIGAV